MGKCSFFSLYFLSGKVIIIFHHRIETWHPSLPSFCLSLSSSAYQLVLMLPQKYIWNSRTTVHLPFYWFNVSFSLLVTLTSKSPVSFYSIHCSHNQKFLYKFQPSVLIDIAKSLCFPYMFQYLEQNVQVTSKSPPVFFMAWSHSNTPVPCDFPTAIYNFSWFSG